MTDPWAPPAATGAHTRHFCPLCDWYLDTPDPDPTPAVTADWVAQARDRHGEAADDPVFLALLAHLGPIDQQIGAHLATHGLIEWIVEVMALRAEVAKFQEPTDWGEPGSQWACGVRRPDGSTTTDTDAPPADDETAVRAYAERMQDSNGYRKALLRRDVSAWREVADA